MAGHIAVSLSITAPGERLVRYLLIMCAESTAARGRRQASAAGVGPGLVLEEIQERRR